MKKLSLRYPSELEWIWFAAGLACALSFSPPESLAAPKVKLTEKAVLRGHTTEINALAFSPDGKTLASGSYIVRINNGEPTDILLWNVGTGEQIGALKCPDWGVDHLAFSPDGKTLVSVGGQGKVLLWDLAAGTYKDFSRGENLGQLTAVEFSPDGKFVAAGAMGRVYVFNAADGARVKTLEESGGNALSFSPDGTALAMGELYGGLYVRSTKDWKIIASSKTISVRCLTYSPDGKYLATGDDSDDKSGTIRVLDASTLRVKKTLHVPCAVPSLAYSPDGRLLAAGVWGGYNWPPARFAVPLWDAWTLEPITSVKGATDTVWEVVFSPDSRLLAAGSWDTLIRLYSVSGGPTDKGPDRPVSGASQPPGSPVEHTPEVPLLR